MKLVDIYHKHFFNINQEIVLWGYTYDPSHTLLQASHVPSTGQPPPHPGDTTTRRTPPTQPTHSIASFPRSPARNYVLFYRCTVLVLFPTNLRTSTHESQNKPRSKFVLFAHSLQTTIPLVFLYVNVKNTTLVGICRHHAMLVLHFSPKKLIWHLICDGLTSGGLWLALSDAHVS